MKKTLFPLLKAFVVAGMLLLSGSVVFAQDIIQISDDSNLGQILTDGEGNTLYYFTKDSELNASSCMGGCVDIWPIFYGESLTLGMGLEMSDFASFERVDGQMQTTYKGWPLYYFVNDNEAGDTNGEAVNNIWFVAKPDYGIMLMDNQLVGNDGVMYNGNYEEGEEEVQYFVDAEGRTIYTWINDTYDQNNFTAADFSNNGVWPIYEEDLQEIPSILDASLFNTIEVHGRQQLTYKGWPLYYFGQDAERGETKGVSVPAPGVWPVAVQDMEAAVRVNVTEIESFNDLVVFPNPFSHTINLSIDLKSNTNLNISMYNSIGKQVKVLWDEDVISGKSTFSFDTVGDELDKGVYFLKIKNEKGEILVLPIIRS